tara:strand:- start:715 stop:1269 length:555 start_codon:yes stop_codon:yes gene_type:complete
MVKNKTGGNKSKKTARKFMNPTVTNRKLRLAEEEGETYATVIKLLGGPNCQVVTNDGLTRLCVIRNKFRGRDKRDNTIAPGVWILVGIRDWEARVGSEQKCDLLEVYTSNEKDKLKKITTLNLHHIIKASEEDDGKDGLTDIVFEDNGVIDNMSSVMGAGAGADAGADTVLENSDDEFIDVDEI